MKRLFCIDFGTTVLTKNPNRPKIIILKVETFDDLFFFKPEIAISTIYKQSFHYVDADVKTFQRKP